MTSDSFASVMLGLGSYAPELRLTNEELCQRMDTSDEWIVSRVGIHERRTCLPLDYLRERMVTDDHHGIVPGCREAPGRCGGEREDGG